jgi:demethoxyubiquinone hydroxylase (CLK1/Coq7/Cat5 family)
MHISYEFHPEFFKSPIDYQYMYMKNMSSNLILRRFLHKVPAYRKPLIDSIIRVDHAGELAADRIYAGQLAVLSYFSKDSTVAPVIKEMWDQEREHLREMERQITRYDVSPTIFAPLCNVAGYALGLLYVYKFN